MNTDTKLLYYLLAGSLSAALVLMGSGCAYQQKDIALAPKEEVELTGTTFSEDIDTVQYDIFPDYHIQPGDVLDVLFQIRTWIKKDRFEIAVDHVINVKFVHSPELNEQQRVRPDGRISLPYIGEYYVVGKTVGEVQDELTGLYRSELRDPELYVVIPEFREAIKELKHDLHTAPRGLSRLVTVRPDGMVTFPMLGEMPVAGKTINEVNQSLNKGYEQILPGLHVDLFLEEHAGSLVYVVGEVNAPGAFPVTRPINLMQAITLAKSVTPQARLDSVVVVRRHGKRMVATRVDLTDTLTFAENTQLFYLSRDDIVFVPKTKLSQAAEVARNIADILFFRGWGIGFSWELHNIDTGN